MKATFNTIELVVSCSLNIDVLNALKCVRVFFRLIFPTVTLMKASCGKKYVDHHVLVEFVPRYFLNFQMGSIVASFVSCVAQSK